MAFGTQSLANTPCIIVMAPKIQTQPACSEKLRITLLNKKLLVKC
jgi:hypothetical protein